MLSILAIVLLVPMAFSYSSNWKFYKEYTVHENTGSDLTDYQVKLTLDTASLISAGYMKSDCSDIRVVDSDKTTDLSFWVEEGTCNTDHTAIWVKIPSLAASSSKTIYVYFGNPSATSASNMDNTFIFGDDFDGSSIDTNKWTIEAETTDYTATVSNGVLTLNGGSGHLFLKSSVSFSQSFVIETRMRADSSYLNDRFALCYQDINNHYLVNPNQDGYIYYYKRVDGTYTKLAQGGQGASSVFNVYEALFNAPDIKIYENGVLQLSYSDSTYSSGYTGPAAGGNTVYFDWYFVRKYASTEPTVTPSSYVSLNEDLFKSGWNYKIPISITENSGSTLTDYQVKVTVDTASLISAGKMNKDCSDIRFTTSDGLTLLPYWIQDGTCNSANTVIWVKVNSIQASSTTTIYMYYNNPSAKSASNGNDVFELFDDFDESSLDTNKWDIGGGSPTVSDGKLVLSANGDYVYSNPNNYLFSQGTSIISYSERTGTSSLLYTKFMRWDGSAIDGNNYIAIGYESGYWGARVKIAGNSQFTTNSQQSSYSANTWYLSEMKWTSGHHEAITDNNLAGDDTRADSYTDSFVAALGQVTDGDTIYIDWTAVRKAVYNEPAVSLGSEVSNPYTLYDLGWTYRKPITITEQSGSDLNNYQVKLTIDTASLISDGKMNSDCSDMRFVDSDDTTALSYWIEDGTCNSASTIVWVKIPSLAASSSKTIYMYYGNSGATSASNGDNTFDFFDDFEDSVSGWVDNGDGQLSQSTDYVKYGSYSMKFYNPSSDAGNGILTYYNQKSIPAGNYVVEMYGLMHSGTYPTAGPALYATSGITNNYVREFLYKNNGNYYSDIVTDGSLDRQNSAYSMSLDTWYHVWFVVDGNTIHFYTPDGNHYRDGTIDPAKLFPAYPGFRTDTSSTDYMDLYIIRKYASAEPTSSIGAEQVASGISVSSITLNPSTIYTTTDVNCSATFSGTGNATLKWYVTDVAGNKQEITSAEQTCTNCDSISGILDHSNFVKGDNVTCVVNVTDSESSDEKSTSVIVSNTVPTAPNLTLYGDKDGVYGGNYKILYINATTYDPDAKDTGVHEYIGFSVWIDGTEYIDQDKITELVQSSGISTDTLSINISSLSDGQHTVEVGVINKGDTIYNKTSTTIVVDNTPPSITINAPVNGTKYTDGENFLFNYTVSDSHPLISTNDTNSMAFNTTNTTATFWYYKNLTDNEYTYTIFATDDVGNTANKTVEFRVFLGVNIIVVGEDSLQPMYAQVEFQNVSADYLFPKYMEWDESKMRGDSVEESIIYMYGKSTTNEPTDVFEYGMNMTNQTVMDLSEFKFTLAGVTYKPNATTISGKLDVYVTSSDDDESLTESTPLLPPNYGTRIVTNFVLDNYLLSGNGTEVDIPLDVPYRMSYGKIYKFSFVFHDMQGVSTIGALADKDGRTDGVNNIGYYYDNSTTNYGVTSAYMMDLVTEGVNDLYVPLRSPYLPKGDHVLITLYSGTMARDYMMNITLAAWTNPTMYVFVPESPSTTEYYKVQDAAGTPVADATITFSRYIGNQMYTIVSTRTGADGMASAVLELHKIYMVTVTADGYNRFSVTESNSGSHSSPVIPDTITLSNINGTSNLTVKYVGQGVELSVSPDSFAYPFNWGSEDITCTATDNDPNLANLTMLVYAHSYDNNTDTLIFNNTVDGDNLRLSSLYTINKGNYTGDEIKVRCEVTIGINTTRYIEKTYYIPYNGRGYMQTEKMKLSPITIYVFFMLITLMMTYFASLLDIRFGLVVFVLMMILNLAIVHEFMLFSLLMIVMALLLLSVTMGV